MGFKYSQLEACNLTVPEQSWVDSEGDPTLSAPADIVFIAFKTIPSSTHPNLHYYKIIDERDDDY